MERADWKPQDWLTCFSKLLQHVLQPELNEHSSIICLTLQFYTGAWVATTEEKTEYVTLWWLKPQAMTGKLGDSHYSWLHRKPIRDNSNFWQWPDCHTLQPDPYWKSILAAPTLALFQSGTEHAGVGKRKSTTLKGKWSVLDLNLINAAPASWELLIGPDRVVKVTKQRGISSSHLALTLVPPTPAY